MRSYTVYEPASQVKILNTVLMEERLLKEIITRNAPSLREEIILKNPGTERSKVTTPI